MNVGNSVDDCIIVHDDDSDDEVFIEKVNFDELDGFPHIVKFIKKLQNHIHIQKRSIDELHRTVKGYKLIDRDKQRSKVNVESQTDEPQKNGFTVQDQVTQTAESSILQGGFAYEDSSGLYYHYESGYYYDPSSGLYYNGHTGTYCSYDPETNTYKPSHPKRRKLDDHHSGGESTEDGECSTESEESEPEENRGSHPPCVRIIVKETNLTNLKVGTLFLVTCSGGSIGREGSEHSVLIPDINTSKHHAKLTYNEERGVYLIVDLGSRNGTYLNGKRISAAKQESEPHELVHETQLQIGGTKLDCHVHPGTETCDRCEPGLTMTTNESSSSNLVPLKSQHKSELKRLKLKFGLKRSNIEEASKVSEGYRDRAQARREVVGSSSEHDKTEQSSLETSIPKSNVGFKMLAKMGWQEGSGLGKEGGDGISEPVPLVGNSGRAGIGNENVTEAALESVSKEKKKDIWKKTQERFNNLQPS